MSKEAALILGLVAAVVNAIVVVAGAGGFDDGLQWEDIVPILAPVLAAVGIRQSVFSQATVDELTSPKAGTTYRQGGKGPG